MNDENRRPSRSGFLKALLVTTDTQQATVAGGVQFLTSSLFFLAGDSPAPANRERKPKKTTDDGHGDGARARASSDGPLALDVFLLLDARQPAVYPLAAAGSQRESTHTHTHKRKRKPGEKRKTHGETSQSHSRAPSSHPTSSSFVSSSSFRN